MARHSALDVEFGEAFCERMLPELRCLIVEFVVLVPYFTRPVKVVWKPYFVMSQCPADGDLNGLSISESGRHAKNSNDCVSILTSTCCVADLFRPQWRVKIQTEHSCTGTGAGVENPSIRYDAMCALADQAMCLGNLGEWQIDFRCDLQCGLLEARINQYNWRVIWDRQKLTYPIHQLFPCIWLTPNSSATFLPLP